MFPVLWLYGPRGVGKTDVGVAIHRAVPGSGYVDIDQLGMCYPERAADPGRFLVKERNLADVVAAHRAAGRRGLVVSGVIDARRGMPALPGDVALTMCRLRADDAELTRRFAGREGSADGVPAVLAEAALLETCAAGGRVVETTGRTVGDIARECMADWPGPESGRPVISVCGPSGVGKSVIGYGVYLRALGDGMTVAYLDLDQLGFGVDPLTVASAVWRNYRAEGAELLVTVGPPMAGGTVFGLTASRDEWLRRLIDRAAGKSWPQPGDPLRGKPEAHLRQVAGRAAPPGPVDHLIDTDGRAPDDVADEIWKISRRPRPS